MRTTNSIVKEIHNHASSAEERLLKEAKRLLAQTDDLDNTGRLAQLKGLGFTSFKEVKALDPKERVKAEQLRDLIETYRLKAPTYHFMTDEAVTELCKKYNLVQGPVTAYADSIPLSNQEDIINFKLDESLLDHAAELNGDITSTWASKEGKVAVRDMDLDYVKNLISFLDRNLQSRGMSIFNDRKKAPKLVSDLITRGCVLMGKTVDDFMRVVFTSHLSLDDAIRKNDSSIQNIFDMEGCYEEPHHFITSCAEIAKRRMGDNRNPFFRIIAAPEMFNVEGLTLTKDMRLLPTPDDAVAFEPEPARIPDPIVQVKVKGGWLNVTAWGEESELDETFDYSRN